MELTSELLKYFFMTNHVTGSGDHAELLKPLSDEQLAEQIEYYRYELSAAEMTGLSRWGWSKLLSTARRVQEERAETLSDVSKQWRTRHFCHVCGEPSVAISDDGWVCEEHFIGDDLEETAEPVESESRQDPRQDDVSSPLQARA